MKSLSPLLPYGLKPTGRARRHACNLGFSGLLLCSMPVIAASTCELPVDLNGHTELGISDPAYRPDNPNAGRQIFLRWGPGTYTLSVLGKDLVVNGTYKYTRLSPGVGQIDMREDFPGGLTEYSVTLVCLTNSSGTLVYTQQRGAIEPQQRQNAGTYILDPQIGGGLPKK
ncbi:hypothetical protein [Pseudomonas fluorescens]|uniref:hypothetical protein n=1 Tax=Pseudomonas fluorescens TaxID=294 RepID=UPI001BE8A562|nr:hypothetical protein [Pseudomonas fluorescens]MBT2375409.1 hypothetical protein [Pseudomonas fluorescens]